MFCRGRFPPRFGRYVHISELPLVSAGARGDGLHGDVRGGQSRVNATTAPDEGVGHSWPLVGKLSSVERVEFSGEVQFAGVPLPYLWIGAVGWPGAPVWAKSMTSGFMTENSSDIVRREEPAALIARAISDGSEVAPRLSPEIAGRQNGRARRASFSASYSPVMQPGETKAVHEARLRRFLDRTARLTNSPFVQRHEWDILVTAPAGGEAQMQVREFSWDQMAALVTLLRPFTLRSEDVFLPNIAESLAAVAPEDERERAALIRADIDRRSNASRIFVPPSEIALILPSGQRSIAQVTEDYIYGELVKTDAEKQARLQELPDPMLQLSLTVGLSAMAKFIAAVRFAVVDIWLGSAEFGGASEESTGH